MRNIARVAFLLCVVASLALPAVADISGTVFRDVDGDGTNGGGVEAGVGGIDVQAFDAASNSPAATATTAANGSYNLVLGAGNYRVEFVIPLALNHFQPGASLSGSGNTSVVFAANGATNVDFGVINPGQFCQADPTLGINCYLKGPQGALNSPGDDVLISFPYDAGCVDEDQNGVCDSGDADSPVPTEVAIGSQIGTTWGMAYHRQSDSLFLTAFQKRHSGFRASGDTGLIYRITDVSTVPVISDYADFDLLGIATADTVAFPASGGDPHPAPADTCTSALGIADPGSTNNNCWLHDTNSYGEIGHISFGDMDVSDDGSTLWTINLFDNTLYSLPVQSAAVVLADIDSFALPAPACNGSLQPFAVGFEDGLVYVGQVCNGPTVADLQAYVHSFDPDNVPGGFTQRLSEPLNYGRGLIVDNGAGASISAAWQPWSDDPADVLGPVFGAEHGLPQPWLTDIEFDNGDLVLGIRDRFSDMSGFDDGTPDNTSTVFWRGDSAGDVLRGCANGANWDFESDANCSGTSTNGAGNGEGPGGGEYYFEERLAPFHDEVTLGGLSQVPINDNVVVSVYDPLNNSAGSDVFSGGVHWYRRSDGQVDNLYRLFLRADPDTFGKAGGLGDIEAFCDAAPLEIGNRLWIDADVDGVQDPGELGLNGVTVELFEDPDGSCDGGDDVLVGSVVSAGSGEYLFTDADVTGGLQFDTNYCLRVAIPAAFGSTLLDATPVGDGEDDIRDSDGDVTPQPGSVVTSFTTGGPGGNRHIYDFGFRALEFDWGDLPDGPYSTLSASNGPNHEISLPRNCFLGGAPDAEIDGQPNATATGDDNDINGDDEDGIAFLAPFLPGSVADIQVTSSAACVLNAWIDFNSDGDFLDAGEQIATNLGLGVGANLLDDVAVPANATGIMAARFRVTNLAGQGGDSPSGAATTGEVEDYVLGAMGDFAWVDNGQGGGVANDGIQNGTEPGLPGITVNLLDSVGGPVLDGAGLPITTTTDLNGNYEFPGLPAASYQVQFVLTSSFVFSPQDQGGDDTLDSDANPVTGITANVAVGVGDNNTTVDAGAVAAPIDCPSGVLYSIDFDRDAANVAIASGATVDSQWSALGVTFSGTANAPGTGPLMIFDSNVASGGDADLASPNDTCDDGANNGTLPGVGIGGEIGSAGENCTPLDNILIISEDGDAGDPNDNGVGGTITVTFDTPLYVAGVGIVDDAEFAIVARDAAGNTLSSNNTNPGFGDNAFHTVIVNTGGVSELELSGPSSGGVSSFELCVPPAAIGNYVWVDENSDGLQDAGEPGIPNAAVELSEDTDGDGVPDTVVATTVTAAAGGYLFPGLPPSAAYFVDVFDGTGGTVNTLAATLTQTTPASNPGSDFGNQDHSGDGYSVVLPIGAENLTADFGYNHNPDGDVNGNDGTAAIGDRVWIDADGDGFQNPNELPLSGVTVDLLGAGPDGVFGNGDDVVATTTTDANGNYLSDGLDQGAYTVTVTPPAGYVQTGDPDDYGLPASSPDNTTTNPVVLAPGDVFLNADFGYQPLADQNNSVGDTVWNDVDGDGVLDPGEPGIPGVTVKLALDLDGDGIWEPFGNDGVPGGGDDEPIIATDTTDGSGNYLFEGVPDGNYVVCVTDTDNVLEGLENTGDPDDDGVPGNGDEDGAGAVALDPTSSDPNPVNDLDQDFGYTDPTQDPGDGAIGDTVFIDLDASGTPDPGEGLEGAVVKLLLDPDGIPGNGDEIQEATDTTDENGNYFFGGLDPTATYTVMVDTATLPPGLVNTVDPDGGLDDMSSVDLSADPDGIDLDQDFGYQPSPGNDGSIGNLVWLDQNADGINDGANGPDGLPGTDDDEPGLAGITLDLYFDENGNGLVDAGEPLMGMAVTDGSGVYLFDNLPVDDGGGSMDYVVDVTDTAGILGGFWHSLGDQSPAVDDNSKSDTYGVTLTPGTPDVATVDFGYYVDPAAIGNRVWVDENFNGLQDPTEVTGIPNVEVTLAITYPNATVVTVVTTTDAAGFYSFPNLLLDEDSNGDGVGPEPTYSIAIDLADLDNVLALAGVGPPTMTDVNDPADDNRDSDDPAGVAASATQGITDMSLNVADPTVEADVEGSYDFGFRALEFDWADLPAPYPTLAAANGPNHETSSIGNCFLGGAPDNETDGQPDAQALGDDNDLNGDDEDGVLFLTPLNPGNVADIQVTSSGSCVLNAWLDFNSDGDFADPGEQIATDLALVAGANLLDDVAVPADAALTMAARFRVTNLTGQGGDSPTGAATTGEVEDYVLACIGDFVWNDSNNGDGVQDGGELGIASVVVNLMANDGLTPITDGAGTAITTVTDANGNYKFPGLPTPSNSGLPDSGDYRIRFDRPAPFDDFSPVDATTDDLDSDAAQAGPIEGITPIISVVAADNNVDVDAGLRAVTATLITSAAAYADHGEVVFEFSTGYEALSAGFELYRRDETTGDHQLVSERLIPALLGSPQGGVYRVVDGSAPLSGSLSYVIVEHQADGKTQAYGPYTVEVGERGERSSLQAGYVASPHVSKRFAERKARAAAVTPRLLRTPVRRSSQQSTLLSLGRSAATVQLNVRESGVYQVTSSDIAEVVGLPISRVRRMISDGLIAIETGGEPVSWTGADRSGSALFFYGEALDSLYTLDNVYQLHLNSQGTQMGRTVGTLPTAAPGGVFTSTEHFEQDVTPLINATLETEVDHWYWDAINAENTTTISSFDVVVPDAVAGTARITAGFAGATDGGAANDHHAIVRINGVEVGTAAWGGIARFEQTFELDGALLTPLTTIEIEGVLAEGSTASIFFIDAFDIEYQRHYQAVGDALLLTGDGNKVVTVEALTTADVAIFDISVPRAPVRAHSVRIELNAAGFQASFVPADAGSAYFATTESAVLTGSNLRLLAPVIDLRATHHDYQHLVIAPEAWRSEAEALAAYRSGAGISSLAISIEDVYDAFSDGIVTPWAIRDLLDYAGRNWAQVPDYVLLAGRGTLDPRDLLGGGDNFIPVVLVGTPYGLIATDNVLADLVGDDAVPEIAFGRLPIISPDELAIYTGKLDAYDGSTGDWRGRALLLADNEDSAGNFPLQSDAVAELLTSYEQELVYLSEMTPADARAALQSAWNDGVQLVNYVGHGGVTVLAAELLLTVADADLLLNGDRLPIVSALTCIAGRSDIPNLESLAESLVVATEGGAIAVWAPTGVSLSGAAHELNLLYVQALEAAAAQTPLGDVVLETLRAFGAAGGADEMLHAYSIVGDPAVALP